MSLLRSRSRGRTRWGLWLPLVGVFACALSAISLAVIGTIMSESVDEEDDDLLTITYGLTLLPSGFDPHIHRSAELGIPLHSVYDTLVYRHPETLEFVAGLADEWEVSENGLIYTFRLKEGVFFHDGTPFNADAVAVTFDRIIAPETGSQKALALLGPYAGHRAVDAYTFELQLSEPYAPLLDALSQPYFGIASPTALANTTNATYQYHQVGTGPFEMVEYIPGDRFVIKRNPDYNWGPVYLASYTDTSVERVIFRFYELPETRRIALEAGDVDLVGELPPTDADLILRNQDFRIHQELIPGQPLQFFFNTAKFPTDDIRIRQALLYATNREAVVGTVFFDQFSPTAYGPLSAATQFYDPAMQTLYPHSLERANTIFESAGVEDSDGDNILDLNGEPLRLKVVFMGFGFLPEVSQLLESQWREIGLEVELVQLGSFADLREYAESGDFNLIAFNDFGVDPAFINRFYLSSGDSNWTRFSDPELDGWLIEATRTTDLETRQELYSAIQRRIMEQGLILPIRDYVNLVGITTRLDGLIYAAHGWWPLLSNLVVDSP